MCSPQCFRLEDPWPCSFCVCVCVWVNILMGMPPVFLIQSLESSPPKVAHFNVCRCIGSLPDLGIGLSFGAKKGLTVVLKEQI